MKHKWKVLVISALLGLAGCNQSPQPTAPDSTADTTAVNSTEITTPEEAAVSTLPADAPVYIVGTIASFPPFVLSDEYGKPKGFDIDIIRAIGEKEGFAVEVITSPWQGLLDMLNSHERDIIATGVVINPERQKKYDFSDPYLDTQWMGILREAPSEGKPKYDNFATAVQHSTKFTTQAESAGVPALEALIKGRTDAEVIEVDSQFMELEQVIRGEADMAYDISRVLQYYSNQMGDYQLYGLINPDSEVEYFGYAVKKGRDDGLVQKINSGLKKIKADGTYDKIYTKWFGEAPTK
ncbi:transporter substrate-binding domain-containing protein [Psychrobacter sp. I-STPA10]|uniref:transporter substrate-binding domain-containing protein n=1 Tax=Psychrobacter sp. I-STPA10 TaxID=2585769 RepID=UPI001E4F32CF|nr:transporter substrate-binding domain-containing protein [Psychrobacter sp. I-STPA10]